MPLGDDVSNPKYQAQVVNNQDEQNRNIALEAIIKQAVNTERRRELDLYKRYASDPEFKRGIENAIANMLMNMDRWSFLTLPDFVFYFLSFLELGIAFALNFRSMYKQIFSSIILKNETKTFFVIKELDRTSTHTVFCLLNKSSVRS